MTTKFQNHGSNNQITTGTGTISNGEPGLSGNSEIVGYCNIPVEEVKKLLFSKTKEILPPSPYVASDLSKEPISDFEHMEGK